MVDFGAILRAVLRRMFPRVPLRGLLSFAARHRADQEYYLRTIDELPVHAITKCQLQVAYSSAQRLAAHVAASSS